MKYKYLKFIFIIFIAIFLVSCRNKVDIQPAIIETGPVTQSVHSEAGKENPIDKPQNPDVLSNDWNGISYLSKEIISYDRMFDVVTNNNDRESNRIDYFISNLNNACVFVTNNYYNYISRNEETINKLIEVVKTDYRLLNTDSEEIKNLFNDRRGITLITLYLEEYRITFCFLLKSRFVS